MKMVTRPARPIGPLDHTITQPGCRAQKRIAYAYVACWLRAVRPSRPCRHTKPNQRRPTRLFSPSLRQLTDTADSRSGACVGRKTARKDGWAIRYEHCRKGRRVAAAVLNDHGLMETSCASDPVLPAIFPMV